MTDKIEIPERVREYAQRTYATKEGISPTTKWVYDLIQKQDNEIGVGDWYYINTCEAEFIFDICEPRDDLSELNDVESKHKKAPKELIAGLEKLRNG